MLAWQVLFLLLSLNSLRILFYQKKLLRKLKSLVGKSSVSFSWLTGAAPCLVSAWKSRKRLWHSL